MEITAEYINQLEMYYFNRIKEAFEKNGMTFIKTICSSFPIKETWEEYGNKKSCFQEALERCIQSTITNNFDWEICGTPVGADSVFVTPKAIIHIDAKCVLNSDNDAKLNCLSVGPNQTSYASISDISINDKKFVTNLPSVYEHEVYGQLVCLTYFMKVCYDREFDSRFCESLAVSLNCFPNGALADTYGTDFLKIGKNNSAKIEMILDYSNYLSYIRKCSNEQDKTAFRNVYKHYANNVLYLNENVRDDTDLQDELTSLYKDNIIRAIGDRSKKINGKNFKLLDYWILDDELLAFIDSNYSTADKDDILDYYESYNNVCIVKTDTKGEDKRKLQTAYKNINLNTYASSVRIDFDKVTDNLDTDSVFFWDHSQEIDLF